MTSAIKEFIHISCTIKHETGKAVLIVSEGHECWLPKSETEFDKNTDGTARVSIPEWLAIKRGIL
jgi:hypothetical protein